MADKQWKADERRVASILKGRRIALSGGPGAVSKADVIAGDLFIEVKRRQRCVVSGWYAECRIKALREGLKPVLVIHVVGSSLYLAVVEVPELYEFLSILAHADSVQGDESNDDDTRESLCEQE